MAPGPGTHPPHCWVWAAQTQILICSRSRKRKALNSKQVVLLAALCLSINVMTPFQPFIAVSLIPVKR